MLNIITGQPGNGKTLWTIQHLEKMRQETGRPVYYHGIAELKLPWIYFDDPSKVQELPDGSIVVIDEAQHHFPMRRQGSLRPPAVEFVQTHRHRGFDLFYITQTPTLIDTDVRKLAGRHYHVKRNFGRERANLYQWEECVSDPLSSKEQKRALKTVFKYPKETYELYKSAEIHTVKKDLPWKMILTMATCVLFALGGFGGMFYYLYRRAHPKPAPVMAAVPGSATGLPVAQGLNPWTSYNLSARLNGIPRTAPRYDKFAQPVDVPRLSGCMELRRSDYVICRCTTQQGTIINASLPMCLDFIENGQFDDRKPFRDVKAENIAYLNSKDRGASAEGQHDPGSESTDTSQAGGAQPTQSQSASRSATH